MMMYINVNFFRLILYGVFQPLITVGLLLLPKLGKGFSQYFFQHFFSMILFLFSLYDSNNTDIKSLVIVQQVTGFCSFFQILFSILFRYFHFIVLSSSTLILSSVLTILLVSPFIKVLILVIFLILKFPLDSSTGFITNIT